MRRARIRCERTVGLRRARPPSANARGYEAPYVFAFASLAISGCARPAVHADFAAQTAPHATIAPADFGALKWRVVGPAVMGGRLDAVAGVPGDPKTIYLGHSSGGLYESNDGGMTFEPIFDAGRTTAIGAIAVAPSNPRVLYAGTGESFPRNTAALGDGVYRSDDAGKTWRSCGLGRDTTHREDRNRSERSKYCAGRGVGSGICTRRGTRCVSHDRRVSHLATRDLRQSDDRRQRCRVRSHQSTDHVRGNI